jgi:hypothetical protein
VCRTLWPSACSLDSYTRRMAADPLCEWSALVGLTLLHLDSMSRVSGYPWVIGLPRLVDLSFGVCEVRGQGGRPMPCPFGQLLRLTRICTWVYSYSEFHAVAQLPQLVALEVHIHPTACGLRWQQVHDPIVCPPLASSEALSTLHISIPNGRVMLDSRDRRIALWWGARVSEWLSSCPRLTSLRVSSPLVSGSSVFLRVRTTSMLRIVLDSCSLEHHVGSDWCNGLVGLTRLYLHDPTNWRGLHMTCPVGPTSPDTFTMLTRLARLRLWWTGLSGDNFAVTISSLKPLLCLTHLDIRTNNTLYDFSTLGQLGSLRWLILDCYGTDTQPSFCHLAQPMGLTRLAINPTPYTHFDQGGLALLTNVRFLEISDSTGARDVWGDSGRSILPLPGCSLLPFSHHECRRDYPALSVIS